MVDLTSADIQALSRIIFNNGSCWGVDRYKCPVHAHTENYVCATNKDSLNAAPALNIFNALL